MMIQLFMEKCEYDRVNEIEDGIKSFKAFIETGVGLDDAINHFNKANEYKAVLDEIEELKNSDTMYDIDTGLKYSSIGTLRGGTEFNQKKNRVEIVVPSTKILHLLAHELKHAYQFETGRINLGKMLVDGTPLYDQTDEIEAYKRSELFGGPTWEEVKDDYKHLRPSSYECPKNSPIKESTLQGWADDYNAIFKAKGKIYMPAKQ